MDLQEDGYEKQRFVSREIQSVNIPRPPAQGGRSQIYSQRKKRVRRRNKRKGAFLIKTGICAAVALTCLLLRFLPGQWSKDARQALHALFTYDLEFDESLGRLKFVQVLFPGITAVFGTDTALYYPVDGILKAAYGEEGQKHVVFKSETGASVKAVADGRVIKRGVHSVYGNYLMIEHASGMVTIYYSLGYSKLEKGDEVKGGDTIATLMDSGELIFELRIDDVAQNPMRYLGAQ